MFIPMWVIITIAAIILLKLVAKEGWGPIFVLVKAAFLLVVSLISALLFIGLSCHAVNLLICHFR